MPVTQPGGSEIHRSAPASGATGPARLAGIGLAAVALLGPALLNGFPLVHQDTGGYLDRGFLLTLGFGRSLFYGLFLRGSAWSGLGLWPAAIAQGLLTAWLIALVLRTEGCSAPLAPVAAALGLALATSAGFVAGQLSPDGLGPCLVLACWLLGCRTADLGRGTRFGLMAVMVAAGLAHMSFLALGLGLAALLHLARAWRSRFGPMQAVAVEPWRPTIAVAAAVLLLLVGNGLIAGRIGFTPGGSVFLLGRLVQDGIAQRYLAAACPDPQLKLCAYRHALPDTANDFIWADPDGPLRQVGGIDGAGDEAMRIVLGSLVRFPFLHARTAIENTVRQFVLFGTGEGLGDDAWHTRERIERLLPEVFPAFAAARQQRDERLDLSLLVELHRSTAWLALLLLAAAFAVAIKRQDRRTGGLIAFILLALLGNAFICGVGSNPTDRYQARLIWLAPFAAMLVVPRFMQRRELAAGPGSGSPC